MSFSRILFEADERGIALVTVNRPEKLRPGCRPLLAGEPRTTARPLRPLRLRGSPKLRMAMHIALLAVTTIWTRGRQKLMSTTPMNNRGNRILAVYWLRSP